MDFIVKAFGVAGCTFDNRIWKLKRGNLEVIKFGEKSTFFIRFWILNFCFERFNENSK